MDTRHELSEDEEETQKTERGSENKDEWRDARPSADSVKSEEWRWGIQPPRDDEWRPGRGSGVLPSSSFSCGPQSEWLSLETPPAQETGVSGAPAETELSSQDRAALHDITGSGHLEINRGLSDGSIQEVERIAERANAVSRALDKLPSHEGAVLRGSAGDLTEAQIARRTGRDTCRGPLPSFQRGS